MCARGAPYDDFQVRYWSLTSLNITQMISDKDLTILEERSPFIVPMLACWMLIGYSASVVGR